MEEDFAMKVAVQWKDFAMQTHFASWPEWRSLGTNQRLYRYGRLDGGLLAPVIGQRRRTRGQEFANREKERSTVSGRIKAAL